MKRLLIISILCSLIFWLTNVFVYYLINYPENFNFSIVIKECVEWNYLLLLYLVMILVSFFCSFVIFKKKNFKYKFYIILIIFNIIGIILVSFIGLTRFIENKKTFDLVIISFRKNAENDIKNDNIKYFSQGLLLPPRTEIEKQKEIVAKKILKEYGLNHSSLGCVIMPELAKAKEEYHKITEPYLEKRNGKNWRKKLKKEMDSIYSRSAKSERE